MRRHPHRLRCLPALLFGVVTLTGCRSDRETGPEPIDLEGMWRPNIVIWMSDTVRQDHLGIYGYHRATSPRVDEFAKDAVVFDRAYAPSAWTKASTASLLTGLNPPRHGAVDRRSRLPEQVNLLSEYLRPLEYYTVAVVTNPNVVPVWGFDQGFEVFEAVDTDREYWQEVRAERVVKIANAHLASRPDRPFFFYLHTVDAHGPNDPDPPYDTMFTNTPGDVPLPGDLTPDVPKEVLDKLVALYDGEINYNDHHFGQLLDRLKADGLYNESLILFVSDHGEEHLDHGSGGHGQQLFEEMVRVPLIVKFPGNLHAGARVSSLAALIDVVPTILRLLNQPVPDELEGINLAELISAAESGTAPERPLFFDLHLERQDGEIHVGRGVLSGKYKYIQKTSPVPKKMLFDLEEDPAEQNNLIDVELERAAELATLVDVYQAGVSAGAHLTLCGSGDGQPHVVEGRLTTQGRFVEVAGHQLEKSDEFSVAKSGKRVEFRVELRAFARSTNVKDKRMFQDRDTLIIRVDPPDAEIVLDKMLVDGEAGMPLFLGRLRERAGTASFKFDVRTERLWMRDVSALFRREEIMGSPVQMGAYLTISRPVERIDINMEDISPGLRRQLKALGYFTDEKEENDGD